MTLSTDPRVIALTALFGDDEFLGVDPETLADLAGRMEWVRLPAGETLIRKGDPGNDVFFVTAGRLRVFAELTRGLEAVGDIVAGETVGEMALVSDDVRSATVCAVRDSQLLRLSRDDFLRLSAGHARMYASLARQLAQRLQERNRPRPVAAAETIAIVSMSSDIPAREIGEQLARRLRFHGRAVVIGADHPDRPSRDDDAVAWRWFDAVESEHRFTLYIASAEDAAWAGGAMRRADRIVVVASDCSSRAALPQALVSRDHLTAPKVDLALWCDTARTVAARPWLDDLAPGLHHHLRRGSSADLDRLSRFLSGTATGLVLSGGGARGFAHIGVLRAFREAGVVIDAVGGTSMGSFIAAHLAAEKTEEEMISGAQSVFSSFWDLTLPIMGVIKGLKMERNVRRIFGDIAIEDLPLRYYCVTSNLTTAQSHVHDRGPLTDWMVTSMSLPVAVGPYIHQGQLYADGGMLDNLPVPAMQRIAARVIGVNVSPDREEQMSIGGEGPSRLSGWRALVRKRERASFPTIGSILYRTAVLASSRETRRIRLELPLLIEPSLDKFGLLAFERLPEIVEAGYAAAVERIRTWRDTKMLDVEAVSS